MLVKQPFHWFSWCSVAPLCPVVALQGRSADDSLPVPPRVTPRITLSLSFPALDLGRPPCVDSIHGAPLPFALWLASAHRSTDGKSECRRRKMGVFIWGAPSPHPCCSGSSFVLYLELQVLWAPLQIPVSCPKRGNGLALPMASPLVLPPTLWVPSACPPL